MNTFSWRADRAFLKAWPSLSGITHHHWQARFAGGLSRRANSVNPLGAHATLCDADIRFFENACRAQNLPLVVRVPALLDADVDGMLARSGFAREGDCCVLHGVLAQAAGGPDSAVSIDDAASREWFDAIHAAQDRAHDQRAIYEAIINAIALPAGFLTLREKNEPVALAYGAIDGDLLCVESVVTGPSHRGKGCAKRLMAAILRWGKARGAQTACLQVEMSNAPALALYRGIGLGGELYRYHYRRQIQGTREAAKVGIESAKAGRPLAAIESAIESASNGVRRWVTEYRLASSSQMQLNAR